MSGFGSCPWGGSPHGSACAVVVPPTPLTDIEVSLLGVIASDMISITFSEDAKVDDALRNPANYTVTPLGGGAPVGVVSVQAGNGIRTNFISLLITDFTVGADYLVTVSNIVGADGSALSATLNTGQFTGRPTKTDLALTHRETLFGRDPDSIIRNVLTALAMEDDLIGGSF